MQSCPLAKNVYWQEVKASRTFHCNSGAQQQTYASAILEWKRLGTPLDSWKWKWKWSDIQPSMVTHTRNLCSEINPSKVHTNSSEHTHTHCEHTPGAVGSHLCCGARGAVGGSVPCSRAPQSWYRGWREHWTFTSPTYNSCWLETRTRNLWITSPTL